MKSNAKILLAVASSLLGIVGGFVGGAYWSTSYAFNQEKQNFLSEVYVQAKSAQVALEKIDKNEIEKGHYIIMSGLAVNIVTLDNMINDAEDEVMKTRIENLLQRIARNRDEFPKYYKASDNQSPETKESISIVNETLRKYKT